MVKLTYTEAMRVQDLLWHNEDEDLDTMLQLHTDIVAEAREKGWKGVATHYVFVDEAVTEVFNDKVQSHYVDLGRYEAMTVFGNCYALIKYLEKGLNNPYEPPTYEMDREGFEEVFGYCSFDDETMQEQLNELGVQWYKYSYGLGDLVDGIEVEQGMYVVNVERYYILMYN